MTMASDSTGDKRVYGNATRDRVAREWVGEQLQDPEKIPELLEEIARDGFTGFRHVDDQEIFRLMMMNGMVDEDNGEDR